MVLMEFDTHTDDASSFQAQSGPASISSMTSHVNESKAHTGSLMLPSSLANAEAKPTNSEILVEGCFAKDLAVKVQANKCSSSDLMGPSLLHTWWGLVQDQMSTLQREVNSLRSSLSQVHSRQAALAQRQDDVQVEIGVETKAILAQVTEEQRNRNKASITMREEAQAWQEAHAQHAKELHEALSSNIKMETSQRTASIDKVVQDIASLRLALDKEAQERSSTKDELTQLSHKLSITIESEKQNTSSSNRKLQMQLAAISGEVETLAQGSKAISAEQKELRTDMQRGNQELRDQLAEEHQKSASAFEGLRRDLLQLQSDINKVRSEQDSCQRRIHEQMSEERASRVTSGEYIGSQVQEILRLLSEVSANQEASYSDLSEQVIGNQKILKLSFENFRSELDDVRSLFETELRQQAVREQSAQEQVDAKLEQLKGPCLSNLRSDLQEELSLERQLRATDLEKLGSRMDDMQSCFGKVRADQAIGEAKLQDHFTKMVIHVQNELAEKCAGFHQNIAETRAHHEEMDKSLGQMVSDMVAEEQKQAQAVLARANQILEADETWRSSLQETLRQEMVSRAEFAHETARLWGMLHVKDAEPDMHSSMCTLPPSSSPTHSRQQLHTANVVSQRSASVVRSVSAGPGVSRVQSPAPRAPPRFAIVQGPVQGLTTPRGPPSPAMPVPGTATGLSPRAASGTFGRFLASSNSMPPPQSPGT